MTTQQEFGPTYGLRSSHHALDLGSSGLPFDAFRLPHCQLHFRRSHRADRVQRITDYVTYRVHSSSVRFRYSPLSSDGHRPWSFVRAERTVGMASEGNRTGSGLAGAETRHGPVSTSRSAAVYRRSTERASRLQDELGVPSAPAVVGPSLRQFSLVFRLRLWPVPHLGSDTSLSLMCSFSYRTESVVTLQSRCSFDRGFCETEVVEEGYRHA